MKQEHKNILAALLFALVNGAFPSIFGLTWWIIFLSGQLFGWFITTITFQAKQEGLKQ